MTELQIALTERFGSHRVDVYKNEQGEMEFTREQIGDILEYENPAHAIKDIHRRHKEFLDRFSGERKLRHPSGGIQNFTTYRFKGFLAICRIRISQLPITARV